MSADFTPFCDLLARAAGLHYPREKWDDLRRQMRPAARELGYADAEQCILALGETPPSPAQLGVVLHHLTIGESYFFRDPASFTYLQQHVVPDLLRRRGGAATTITVLSAGCSQGQEAYSAAIAVQRALPAGSRCTVSVVGADLDEAAVRTAERGVYTSWSFRGAPEWLLSQYFLPHGPDRYEIIPAIRALVTFRRANLIDAAAVRGVAGGSADVVFCRNVMLYLTPEANDRVLSTLETVLADDGTLFVSPTETGVPGLSRFCPVRGAGTAVFIKKASFAEAGRQAASPVRPARRRAASPGAAVARRRAAGAAPSSARVPVDGERRRRPRGDAFDEVLTEARGLLERGEYREAEERLAPLLAAQPDHSGALALAARAWADRGLLQKARDACRAALRADPTDAEQQYLWAMIHLELGDAEEAAAALRRTLYLDGGFALAYCGLDALARSQGRLEEASRQRARAVAALRALPADAVVRGGAGTRAGELLAMMASGGEA